MIKKIFYSVLVALFALPGCCRPPCDGEVCKICCSTTSAKIATNADEAYNACCRVVSNGSAGTGTAFYQSESGEVYILTNYHVSGNRAATVEFFDSGLPVKYNATNVTCGYDQNSSLDYAILKLNAADSSNVKNIIPLWNNSKSLLEQRYCIDTIGCPHALHLRMVRGVIQSFNANSNIVFAPTPYGGQSGSAILGEDKSGRPYVVGLLTWRTDEEGRDSYGGLAQPIARVINDIERRGVSFGESNELPANAVITPYDINTPRPASENNAPSLLIEGKRAWECSNNKPILEVYTIEGCAPCAALKARLPEFQKYADVKIYNGGSPSGTYPACYIKSSNGSLLYPSLIVGFNDTVYSRILTTLKANAVNNAIEESTANNNALPRAPVRQGVFPFAIPRTGEEQEPPIIEPKSDGGLFGKLAPKSEEPQEQKRGGLLDGLLFDNLYSRVVELLNATIKELTLPLLLLVYCACLAAILSAKVARGLLLTFIGIVKKLLKLLASFVTDRAARVQSALVEDIASKLEKIENLKAKSKDK